MPDSLLCWPNGLRCAVMLSFDVDGPTNWINRDPRVWGWPRTFSMGAYGPWRALPRILDVLEAHSVPATFFVPGWVAEVWPDRFREIVRAGHEVGHHGYLHELFFDKSIDEQRAVITRSQEIFRRLVGHSAVGYRTPSGDFSRETPRLLLELGFSYSSSMRGDDRPYPVVIETRPSALIEIPTHSELDDFAQFGYNYFPVFPKGQDRIAGNDAAFDIWQHELDGYHRFGLCLVTVMHPQVIGTPGRIRLLERFIRYAQSYGDVWFARGAEIADWSRAHHSAGGRGIELPDA